MPILLFAVAFGLSTDYGVFLLSRIKEARDAGASDSECVAIGLERTGRIVTAAAVLFAIAIGAFATSQIIFIKQNGIGTALAVLIDATHHPRPAGPVADGAARATGTGGRRSRCAGCTAPHRPQRDDRTRRAAPDAPKEETMYKTIAKRKARATFEKLSAGDWRGTRSATSPPTSTTSSPVTTPSAASATRATRWSAGSSGSSRCFPNLSFEVKRVAVRGLPWDMWVAVEWIDRAEPRDGVPYENEGAHWIRLQRGKATYIHAYLDTEKVTETCERLARGHRGGRRAADHRLTTRRQLSPGPYPESAVALHMGGYAAATVTIATAIFLIAAGASSGTRSTSSPT